MFLSRCKRTQLWSWMTAAGYVLALAGSAAWHDHGSDCCGHTHLRCSTVQTHQHAGHNHPHAHGNHPHTHDASSPDHEHGVPPVPPLDDEDCPLCQLATQKPAAASAIVIVTLSAPLADHPRALFIHVDSAVVTTARPRAPPRAGFDTRPIRLVGSVCAPV